MAASSSPIHEFNKDPVAVLDYGLNWADWLLDDVISSSTWTLPAGISNAGELYSSTSTAIWLGGGTAGTSYSITNLITTLGGKTDKRTIKINVVER